MQRKDLALIAATALFSAVMSFVVSGVFISPSTERSQTAEVVEPITDEFRQAPEQYFNSNAINPTQLIEISPEAPDNNVPFGSQ